MDQNNCCNGTVVGTVYIWTDLRNGDQRKRAGVRSHRESLVYACQLDSIVLLVFVISSFSKRHFGLADDVWLSSQCCIFFGVACLLGDSFGYIPGFLLR